MASISLKFYLNRDKVNPKTGTIPIYARLLENRVKKEFRLPKTFDLKPSEDYLWDEMNQRLKSKSHPTNHYLNEVESTFQKIITFSNSITIHELSIQLQNINRDVKNAQEPLLIDYLDRYLEEEIETPKLAEGTKKNYRNAFRQFKHYLQFEKLDKIRVNQFSFKEAQGFKLFLEKDLDPKFRKEELSKKVRNKEVSSSTKVKNIKPVFVKAVKEGYFKESPFDAVKLNHDSPKSPHLTAFEIKSIYDFDTSMKPELDLAKDIFLFICFTGLSITDVLNLTTTDIKPTSSGRLTLLSARQKTDSPIRQIIIKPAELIIKKYQNAAKLGWGTKVFPSITDVDINRKLKIIASYTGIMINLTTKTGRITCLEQIYEAGINDPILTNVYMGWSQKRENKVKLQYMAVTEMKLLEFSSKFELYYHNVLKEGILIENEVISKANALVW